MERNKKQVYTEFLVLQCQEGDQNALKSLIKLWQDPLSGFAYRMTGSTHAVGDVMQEAWIAISRQIFRLNDPACFKRWAYRIVSNKCVDWVRQQERNRKLREGYQQELDDYVDDRQRNKRNRDLVQQAIAELPYKQRLLVTLFYMEGFGVNEIAHMLRIPAGTVKSRLYKVRINLKQIIEKEI